MLRGYLIFLRQFLYSLMLLKDSTEDGKVPQVEKDILSEEVENSTENKKVREDCIAKTKYFENLSTYYLRTSTGNLKNGNKKGLKLSVNELIYYRNETYMVFELENKSGIDFELNYLNVFLTQGNRKRNASFQKVLKSTLYTHTQFSKSCQKSTAKEVCLCTTEIYCGR